MNRLTILLMAAALALMPGLLVAQDNSRYNNSVPTVWPGPEAARISGTLGKPNREIFGVRFIEINGVTIQPRSDMWLEPGSYTIKVLIDAAHTRRSIQRRRQTQRQDPGYNEIELELEANRTYEIRGRYDPNAEGSRYSVIVHQVLER